MPLLRSPYFFLLASFAGSRWLYYLAGVRFDAKILANNFQFIDLVLLRTRLAESLWYFQMQPPLPNLIVGLALRAFPQHYSAALHALYLVIGAASAILLYRVMTLLGVRPAVACGVTIFFITSPGCVLFENYPMYEYPLMLVLPACALALYRLLSKPGWLSSLLLFSWLAVLCYLRNIFPLHLIAALLLAMVWYLRSARRQVLIGALLPLAVILTLYAKYYALFGMFSSSSWLGINLGTTCTNHNLTSEERERLIASGKLLPIARIDDLAAPQTYYPFVGRPPATGIPVLDQEHKSSGVENFNNLTYMRVSKMYLQVGLQILRYAPAAYVRSVSIAWFCYFLPPTDFFQFVDNRAAIRPLERFYNRVIFGQFRETSRKGLRELRAEGRLFSLVFYTGLFLLIALPALLIWAGYSFYTRIRRRVLTAAQIALWSAVLFEIVWVMLTSNFLSSFENNRYRFPTDGLYCVLAALLLESLLSSRRLARPVSLPVQQTLDK
jgi:hypothetical protein